MLLAKAVAAASFLITVFNAISAMPQPAVIRERHIIHAPIKFKIIHHHNIKKIPIVIKKHLHYYKAQEEVYRPVKPTFVRNIPNQIHQDDSEEHYNEHKFQKEASPEFKIPFDQDHPETPEEDYEEPEQSQEEHFEDYEYE